MAAEPLELVLRDVIRTALITRPPFAPGRVSGIADSLGAAVDHIVDELSASGAKRPSRASRRPEMTARRTESGLHWSNRRTDCPRV